MGGHAPRNPLASRNYHDAGYERMPGRQCLVEGAAKLTSELQCLPE